MNRIIVITVILTMVTCACAKHEKASMVIINGNVLTMDKDNPHAEALAVSNGIIIATGSSREIRRYIEHGKTKVIDANGRLVIPGFNDAHAHFGPVDPDYVELRYVTDPSVISMRVRQQAARSDKGVIIKGGHWDHELFTDKKWPTKELIDSVSPDNPVILSRTDGHSILVNSRVLKESGITRDTPDPFGGEIVRDPLTGEPTGVLKESAIELVKIRESKSERTEDEKAEYRWNGYMLALKQAAEYGVTSIQIPGEADFEMYRKIKQNGILTARIDIGGTLTYDDEKLRRYEELRKEYPQEGEWIRFGYLKGFMDGTLGSATAMMYEPFIDDADNTGLLQMSYEELETKVLEADKRGFQIGIHAIGPKANNWILNAYEKAATVNGRRDSRHRSEHAQILSEPDIIRFKTLGVIPSMQPTHCITDKNFAEKRIGIERCRWAYAWKSLADNGAMLAFGTDYSVESLNPMEGLYAATTRKDRKGEEGEGWIAEEKLTMEEAIRYYTLGSAYAQFMEDRKGMLRMGYLADVVIMNSDLLSLPESEIMKAKADITITGGNIVFER